MKIDIHAGKRVLYKDGNSGWLVGEVDKRPAEVNEKGVWIAIIPKQFIGKPENEIEYIQYAEINNIFTETTTFDPVIKSYSEYYMSKEDYLKFIEGEDFDRASENAYFTDGEYIYYPVSKYSKSWIEKQPFDYIIRGN